MKILVADDHKLLREGLKPFLRELGSDVAILEAANFSETQGAAASAQDLRLILLDLSMPGMQMGKNQVTLFKKNACLYEGKGIIVRCMSKRTLWQVKILSDELKNTAFTINVRD